MGTAELTPPGLTFVTEDLHNELFRVVVPVLIMQLLIEGPEWNCFSPSLPLVLNSSSEVFYLNYFSSMCKSCPLSFKCTNLHTFNAKALYSIESGTLSRRDWVCEVDGR